jgi:hypothetical protein
MRLLHLIEDHLKQGGRAVLVRDQEIVLKTARRGEQVLHLPKNPKSTPKARNGNPLI